MKKRDWLIPAVLIVLSLVPVAAGAVRMSELARGAQITPDNARFFAAPVPIVLHIVSVTLYALLGAFQFAPAFRRRHPRWHRRTGFALAPLGVLAASTGLWMQTFYALPPSEGALLAAIRYTFGSAMLLSLLLGIAAVLRRDFVSHGAWMLRAYAIGMGAATQVFTHLPWLVLMSGAPTPGPRALMMGAGWVINVAIAEWIIRRRSLAMPAPISAEQNARRLHAG